MSDIDELLDVVKKGTLKIGRYRMYYIEATKEWVVGTGAGKTNSIVTEQLGYACFCLERLARGKVTIQELKEEED